MTCRTRPPAVLDDMSTRLPAVQDDMSDKAAGQGRRPSKMTCRQGCRQGCRASKMTCRTRPPAVLDDTSSEEEPLPPSDLTTASDSINAESHWAGSLPRDHDDVPLWDYLGCTAPLASAQSLPIDIDQSEISTRRTGAEVHLASARRCVGFMRKTTLSTALRAVRCGASLATAESALTG